MAEVLTEFGHITPRSAAYVYVKLLERALPQLVTEPYAQAFNIPNNEGKVGKWRRYASLTSATTPLAEGVAPDGQRLTYTDVQVTMEQYGDRVNITDVIQDVHEDPIINGVAVPVCAEQIARTMEENRIEVWKAGTSVFYAGGTGIVARNTVAATVSRGDLRYITRQLDANFAKEISSVLAGSPNYDTEPVDMAYFAFCHSDLIPDFLNLPGFIPARNYAQQGSARIKEIGSIDRIRVIATPLFTPFEDTGALIGADGFISTSDVRNDVYPVIIMGQNAVGTVSLRGNFAFTPIVVQPNIPNQANPLGQQGHVGWKRWAADLILDDNMIYRYECACTENPD
jgi:N4-gp56 family major capsid protein